MKNSILNVFYFTQEELTYDTNKDCLYTWDMSDRNSSIPYKDSGFKGGR